MKSFNNIMLISLFLAYISFFGAIIFITPDKDTSDVENRSLAQQPSLELESIVKGEYTKQFESFITDQFYSRNEWVKAYLNWQLLTNQTFIYDYYIDDNWVYPKPFTKVDEEAISDASKNMKELNQYSAYHDIELYYFSLPDRRHMLDIDYPKWVEEGVGQADKEMFLSKLPKKHIDIVDVGVELDKDYNQEDYRDFYFQTDHHWNMYGAFSAYEVIRNTFNDKSAYLNDSPFNKDSYTEECLTNKNFMGAYNQQLYGMIDSSNEKMCYFNSNNVDTAEWTTYVNGMEDEDEVPFSSVYGRAKEVDDTSISYSQLYSSDHSEIHIINPEKSTEDSKALFLKDSYANPLLPLIAENFYHTTFYDMRHNEGENLYDYIERHDFDVVSFLYGNGRTLPELYQFGDRPSTED